MHLLVIALSFPAPGIPLPSIFLGKQVRLLCERVERITVLFPRYFKAPGYLFLRWTTAQWCRIVDQTVARFAKTCPVSVIHTNSGSVCSWAGVRAAKRYHIPCVVTYQDSEVYTTLAHHHKGWRLCRDSFRLA